MNALVVWNTLSSGKVPEGKALSNDVTLVPAALLELLKDLGELATSLAKIVGVFA